MTPRERTLAAFRFEDVAPVPYTIWYDDATRQALTRHYGGTGWQDRIENHIVRLTVDWEPRAYVDATHFKDLHGTLWQDGNPIHVVAPALTSPRLDGFDIPPYVPYVQASETPPADGHTIVPLLSYADTARRLAAVGTRAFTVVGYGYGFFERAWMIRGYEAFFSDLLLEPAFAHGLLDLLLERHLDLLDELLKLPCDGIIFSDDYGDQRGVITGPDLWRTFVRPRLEALYARVHAAGKLVFQHSCGNVFDIIPDLADVGLDVLQSLQAEAMPVYEIKRRYGDRLRLWGGVGTQRLLPQGRPDEIRAEVHRLQQELGKGGGYVLSSCKPIMQDVPLENAIAFIEAATGAATDQNV